MEDTRQYDYAAKRELARGRSYVRTPMFLALFGILTSFLFGAGIFFSVPALCLSVSRGKTEKSQTLRWAFVLSLVGTVFCLVVIVLFFAAVAVSVNVKG